MDPAYLEGPARDVLPSSAALPHLIAAALAVQRARAAAGAAGGAGGVVEGDGGGAGDGVGEGWAGRFGVTAEWTRARTGGRVPWGRYAEGGAGCVEERRVVLAQAEVLLGREEARAEGWGGEGSGGESRARIRAREAKSERDGQAEERAGE
jgi:hypothetical protein